MDIIKIVEKDFFIIFVCILALGACLATIYGVSNYQDRINTAWQKQWDDKCVGDNPLDINIPFNVWGKYNGTDDIINNT